MDSASIPPQIDEIEVSIFGPGYGEAIALHLGNGNWILVDSCLEPSLKKPASLNYLKQLGIDPESAVKTVVLTHWHDDHHEGISLIFDECKHADFIMSGAVGSGEFLQMVTEYTEAPVADFTGIDELSNLFDSLKKRKVEGARFKSPIWAVEDKILYSESFFLDRKKVFAKIYSLSPSNEAILQSWLAIETQNRERFEDFRRIASPSKNQASVALLIEVEDIRIILGSDLEKTNDPTTGWSAVLNSSRVVNGKSGVFKIPHHGSENAHVDRVWVDLLLPNPYALLSPFNLGRHSLPTPEDVDRINHLTTNAYITAPNKPKPAKFRDRVIRDEVKAMTKKVVSVHTRWGHIRLRKKILHPENTWSVDLFGDACCL
ncbi:MBL fold metallo-hydrolase [candidate division KSB1 bacterium]|nr:MBL fold metallo-hydrolase [candidate division KSB1 bacterium]